MEYLLMEYLVICYVTILLIIESFNKTGKKPHSFCESIHCKGTLSPIFIQVTTETVPQNNLEF